MQGVTNKEGGGYERVTKLLDNKDLHDLLIHKPQDGSHYSRQHLATIQWPVPLLFLPYNIFEN